MIARTSRSGGVWLRAWLILRWETAETAWFGWHRVDREEARRVTSQAVQRDHPDPGVHRVDPALAGQKPGAQSLDFAQCFRVVEGQQVGICRVIGCPRQVDRCPGGRGSLSTGDAGRKRGPDNIRAEWIDIVRGRRPAHQCCLHRGGAPAGERVVDPITRDWSRRSTKNAGKLRFEAGSVADFVQAVAAALARRSRTH